MTTAHENDTVEGAREQNAHAGKDKNQSTEEPMNAIYPTTKPTSDTAFDSAIATYTAMRAANDAVNQHDGARFREAEETPEFQALQDDATKADYAFAEARIESLPGALVKVRELAKEISEVLSTPDSYEAKLANSIVDWIERIAAGNVEAPYPGYLFTQWEAEYHKAQADALHPKDDEELTQQCKVINSIRARITQTPAGDHVGVMVKLRVIDDLAEGYNHTDAQSMMHAVMADIDRLAAQETSCPEIPDNSSYSENPNNSSLQSLGTKLQGFQEERTLHQKGKEE